MDNAQVNAMLREALDYLDRIATSLETIAGECANLEIAPEKPCDWDDEGCEDHADSCGCYGCLSKRDSNGT